MKRVIIIQARMTSTRLPGKVLMNLCGHPMLYHQIQRLKRCTMADEIVVATTMNETDDPVVALAHKEEVGTFRGSEHDVLARFAGAAAHAKADVVVRVTADCPLLDPQVIDQVIAELVMHAHACDYVSTLLPRTYPRGLDVEACFADTLYRVNRMAQSHAAREHVTLFIYAERPELFVCRSVCDTQDNADLRLTVDTPADFELIQTLFETLSLDTTMLSYRDIIAYLRNHPEIVRINADQTTWNPLQPR